MQCLLENLFRSQGKLLRGTAMTLVLVFTSWGCQQQPPSEKPEPAVKLTTNKEEPPESEKATAEATPHNKHASDAIAWANNLEDSQMIDLTHPLDAETIYWPTEEDFKLEKEFAGITERGYYYASNRFTAAEHGGTHVDAPIHFSENGLTVDEVPLKRLCGPAAVIDITQACQADRNYQVSIEDLHRWEEEHGTSLNGHIVLLKTGFSRHWPDRKKYLGTELRGPEGVKALQFPGLDPAAAEWLASSRAIRSIGIDTASIDHGPSQNFQSHVTLFKNNIPALENVAHLEQLPAHGAWIMALPIKIGGGSGGPTRIVAMLPQTE